ncbi:exodeoxyribonuclease III [Picosynechococcus sp. PCC 8807]|uniref:exodeoxyribonuclease III n=1 Tax=Picosynechococcus sp. PCC 8807 TaxID=195248 RepID=UPI00081078CB|nr:exodeoxyribonuclease III [Picosynechococcus sp. PCC 8807]ANV90311.1 exodeoxyribonuclease III [Picosynechococcus sp. PCC 8807]
MEIATWNVNSVRSRQTHICQWLEQTGVDLLCLQETKVVDPDFPRQPFEALGYHTSISGQKSYNGVALLSREPLQDVIIGFTPVVGAAIAQDFDAQKRVISGVIGDVRVVNLYVPNGSAVGSEKYDYKLGWFEVLKAYLKELCKDDREILMCGDFNIALEDRDIYMPKKPDHIMASPAERETLTAILDFGFQDVFRKFNQDADQFSWWDYRTRGFSRNRGWRIDHIYLTEKLYGQAKRCWIDREPRGWEKPSDHTPVIVEL